MPYLYTTSASDIFAPFHLKYAIPRQAAISLIAYDCRFVKTNLGKHNLAKLTNNQATQELKHPQCGPIIQDRLINQHLLTWTQAKNWLRFFKSTIKYATHSTYNTMAISISGKAVLQTNLHPW